jgi:hypothetical protein
VLRVFALISVFTTDYLVLEDLSHLMEPELQKATQIWEETPAEASFRKQQSFPDIEASLDSVSLHASAYEAKKSKPSIVSRVKAFRTYLPPITSQLVDNVSSYFGRANPLAVAAKPGKDSVWLFDNTAYRRVNAESQVEDHWHAQYLAAFFNRDSGKDVSEWVADIADKVGLREMDIPDDEGEQRIAERIRPFLDGIRPARYVDVVIKGKERTVHRLGPAGRSALAEQTIGPLRGFHEGQIITTHTTNRGLTPHGPMQTFFAGPEGWTVISGSFIIYFWLNITNRSRY